MAEFFNYYPSIYYSGNTSINGLDTVTNIIARFGFEQKFKNNSLTFYPYQIREGDTPEIIAYKFYGDVERHWIVLMFNDIIDPQYEWPLSYNSFIDYVDKKYSANGAANTTVQTGLAWAMSINNTHSYYKIIKTSVADGSSTGSITTEKIEVDANTYANVASSSNTYTLQDGNVITVTTSKEKKTYYDYEVETNEEKREINLLKPEFVTQVEEEFKRVISL